MRLLLDTHTLLWMLEWRPRLSPEILDLLRDPANRVHVSIASLWEITIKRSLGKLALPVPWDDLAHSIQSRLRFPILSIEFRDPKALLELPHHHRDPFDRMLVAQCFARGLQLISNDAVLDAYGVSRLW